MNFKGLKKVLEIQKKKDILRIGALCLGGTCWLRCNLCCMLLHESHVGLIPLMEEIIMHNSITCIFLDPLQSIKAQ
jgi:hypothetical protein